MKIKHKTKACNPKLSIFFGVSVGCFLGTGYGVVFGLGKTRCDLKKTSIVYPSRNPFVYSGVLTGCYCGIICGFGFGNNLTNTIGFTKKLELKFLDGVFFL